MGQGASQNVYMADDSGQAIFVMAALSEEWAIVDFITDATLLVTGATGFAAATVEEVADLPAVVNTFGDLYQYIKAAVQLISRTDSVDSRARSAAQVLVDAYTNTSIQIASNDYKNVQEEGVLNTYLTPSGIAGLLGAKTVSVMVLSGDGKQLAMWDTGADDSWIATNQQTIVRAAYGSIWQQDPSSGTEDWSDMISS